MKVLTVKLDDELSAELENYRTAEGYPTQSAVVRQALRSLMVEARKRRLRASAERYMGDQSAYPEVADVVDARMTLTEEALPHADT